MDTYEQKYKEANDKIAARFGTNVAKEIFTDLYESEDEKIRKELLENLRELLEMYNTLQTTKEYGKVQSWITWLEKQGEQKEYTFKSIPRLLEMMEPTDRAKAYCQKLIDTLAKEGYNTDAKIVGECLKQMNGEDVPMAVMDEQKPAWSEEDEVRLQACLDTLQAKSLFGVVDTVMTEWLKSLKERIGG